MQQIVTGLPGGQIAGVFDRRLSVAAGVALTMHEHQRLRLASAAGKRLKQGKDAGIGERDSQGYGSRDGEGNHKSS